MVLSSSVVMHVFSCPSVKGSLGLGCREGGDNRMSTWVIVMDSVGLFGQTFAAAAHHLTGLI